MSDSKEAVFFGELLMRLATKRYERFVQAREFEVGYTGAEANAAVSLAHYGLRASLVSVVPDTEIGEACVNYIRQFGVNTDFVLRGGKRLGTFYLETGASQRPSKVIYDRAGSSITELTPGKVNWDAVFAGKQWFHWSGTAPALSDSMAATTREACQAARNYGLTVSCDLNYRRKLWPPEKARAVMTGLMQYVDVLIGNEEDSALVLGVAARGVDVAKGSLTRSATKKWLRNCTGALASSSSPPRCARVFPPRTMAGRVCCPTAQQCYLSRKYESGLWIASAAATRSRAA